MQEACGGPRWAPEPIRSPGESPRRSGTRSRWPPPSECRDGRGGIAPRRSSAPCERVRGNAGRFRLHGRRRARAPRDGGSPLNASPEYACNHSLRALEWGAADTPPRSLDADFRPLYPRARSLNKSASRQRSGRVSSVSDASNRTRRGSGRGIRAASVRVRTTLSTPRKPFVARGAALLSRSSRLTTQLETTPATTDLRRPLLIYA